MPNQLAKSLHEIAKQRRHQSAAIAVDPISQALTLLTKAREAWMLNHNDDFDVDFYAGLFENARISLEIIAENCGAKMDGEGIG